MLIPHFVQNELDASDTDLANRLSAFNWSNPFDRVLPFTDGTIGAGDKAHLWGLYAGISVRVLKGPPKHEGLLPNVGRLL